MSITLKKKKLYEWGYDDGLFNKPQSGSVFKTRFYSPLDKIDTLRTEIGNNAKYISDMYQGEEIIVSFSGGYDSQAVALAYKELGIPFRLISKVNRQNGNILNNEELESGKVFAVKHGLNVEYLYFDIEERLPFYLELAQTIKVPLHWIQYLNMEVGIQNPNAVVVMGSGDPIINLYSDDPREMILTPDSSCIATELNLKSVDRFYGLRSNALLSYMYHPICNWFINSREVYQNVYENTVMKDKCFQSSFFEYYIKPLVFASEYPNGELVHQRKLNGWEGNPDYMTIKDKFITATMNDAATNHTIGNSEQWLKLYNREVEYIDF